MMINNIKMQFARTLADTVSPPMSDCYRYGMIAGCDEGCPVLIAGDCELQDTDNKELYKLAIESNA